MWYIAPTGSQDQYRFVWMIVLHAALNNGPLRTECCNVSDEKELSIGRCLGSQYYCGFSTLRVMETRVYYGVITSVTMFATVVLKNYVLRVACMMNDTVVGQTVNSFVLLCFILTLLVSFSLRFPPLGVRCSNT